MLCTHIRYTHVHTYTNICHTHMHTLCVHGICCIAYVSVRVYVCIAYVGVCVYVCCIAYGVYIPTHMLYTHMHGGEGTLSKRGREAKGMRGGGNTCQISRGQTAALSR